MIKVECGKCGGKGEIKMYSNIAGGICFACNGKGHTLQKNPPRKSTKYAVSAIHKESGERINVFRIKARSEAEALKRAIATLSGGKDYDPQSANVKPE